MPVLQIYLDDKEYNRFRNIAKKRGISARKYAYKLLFRRANSELDKDMIAEIRAVYGAFTTKAYIIKEYRISRYKLNKIINGV